MSQPSRRRSLATSRFARALRRNISLYPGLYLPIRKFRKPETVVTRQTELLVEGFPRSGNTWMEALLRSCSERDLRLAHHSHAAGHVKYAVKIGAPTVVLYRDPDDAVRSYLTLYNNSIDARDAYLDYITFYEAVFPLRDKGVLFFSFDEVTQAPSKVIDSINSSFSIGLDSSVIRADGGQESVYKRMDQKAARLGRAQGKSDSRPGNSSEETARQREIAKSAIDRPEVRSQREVAKRTYQKLISEFAGKDPPA